MNVIDELKRLRESANKPQDSLARRAARARLMVYILPMTDTVIAQHETLLAIFREHGDFEPWVEDATMPALDLTELEKAMPPCK